jgi:ABC-type amino acid transport substrate-binding protein
MTDLPARLRNGIETKAVTLRRPATLIDCLSMVERGEAEALIGNEAETRFAISRLGLASAFKMADTPLMTRGIHIVIPKQQPGAEELLEKVNAAIADFKKTADYGAIIARHLPSLMAGTLAKAE